MKLMIRPDSNANAHSLSVTDGQQCALYRVNFLLLNRKEVIQVVEMNGHVIAAITRKSGLFREEASYSLKSGDLVTIKRNVRTDLKSLTVSGCDWVVQGTEFPSDYSILGGYGRFAAVRTAPDYTEVELSLTAVAQDVLCFVLSITFLFMKQKDK